MKRFLCAFAVLVIVALLAADAQAQRRRGCNSGCGSSNGCNVNSGSNGCNVSSAPAPVQASPEDLLQQTAFKATPARTRALPPLPAVPREIPLVLNERAALAFCAPQPLAPPNAWKALAFEPVRRPTAATIASR